MDWDGKGGGEEWGDVEGGETIIRIYVIREKNLFSIKGEKEKNIWENVTDNTSLGVLKSLVYIISGHPLEYL